MKCVSSRGVAPQLLSTCGSDPLTNTPTSSGELTAVQERLRRIRVHLAAKQLQQWHDWCTRGLGGRGPPPLCLGPRRGPGAPTTSGRHSRPGMPGAARRLRGTGGACGPSRPQRRCRRRGWRLSGACAAPDARAAGDYPGGPPGGGSPSSAIDICMARLHLGGTGRTPHEVRGRTCTHAHTNTHMRNKADGAGNGRCCFDRTRPYKAASIAHDRT